MKLLNKIKSMLGIRTVEIEEHRTVTKLYDYPPEIRKKIETAISANKLVKFEVGDMVSYILEDIDNNPRRPRFNYAHVVDIEKKGRKQEWIGIKQSGYYIRVNPILLKKI